MRPGHSLFQRLGFALAAAPGLLALPAPAEAALPVGARAPAIVAPAAQGGRRFTFDLARALRRGPVVIYFFPRAFTSGCTIETHAFADAAPEFRRAGATLIGMSTDDVETLGRFSTEACRAQFPMASASGNLVNQYDVLLREGISTRTSYVIARDGTIAMVHNDMNPNDHVRLTLATVRDLRARRRR